MDDGSLAGLHPAVIRQKVILLRLDFHTHGKLAKKLPFSTVYTDWLFDEARRAGLDALCLTEHFNTLQFSDLYGYLASKSRRVGDTAPPAMCRSCLWTS